MKNRENRPCPAPFNSLYCNNLSAFCNNFFSGFQELYTQFSEAAGIADKQKAHRYQKKYEIGTVFAILCISA
jgi:hypothetical protein